MRQEGRKERGKKNHRKYKIGILCVGVTAGLLLAMTGFLGKEKQEEDNYRIAAILPVEETNPFWNTVWEGVRDCAEKENVCLSEYQYDSYSDDSVEDLLEIAILSKTEGIILRASDYTTQRMENLLEKAKEEGIRMVFADSDGEVNQRDVFVGADNEEAGKKAAEILTEQYQPEKIWEIRNDGNPTSVTMRESAFYDYLEEQEKMPEISTVVLTGAEEVRYQTAQEVMLQVEQGDAVICLGANTTLIAAKTVERLNLQEQIFLIGFGESEEALDYTESGEIDFLFAQENYEIGYQAMDAAVEILRENSLEDYKDRYVKIEVYSSKIPSQ